MFYLCLVETILFAVPEKNLIFVFSYEIYDVIIFFNFIFCCFLNEIDNVGTLFKLTAWHMGMMDGFLVVFCYVHSRC